MTEDSSQLVGAIVFGDSRGAWLNGQVFVVSEAAEEAMQADDKQVGGTHYMTMPVQPWEVMEHVLSPAEFRGFLKGSIIKYGMRAGKKEGAVDDEAKARHYMDKLREVGGRIDW